MVLCEPHGDTQMIFIKSLFTIMFLGTVSNEGDPLLSTELQSQCHHLSQGAEYGCEILDQTDGHT